MRALLIILFCIAQAVQLRAQATLKKPSASIKTLSVSKTNFSSIDIGKALNGVQLNVGSQQTAKTDRRDVLVPANKNINLETSAPLTTASDYLLGDANSRSYKILYTSVYVKKLYDEFVPKLIGNYMFIKTNHVFVDIVSNKMAGELYVNGAYNTPEESAALKAKIKEVMEKIDLQNPAGFKKNEKNNPNTYYDSFLNKILTETQQYLDKKQVSTKEKQIIFGLHVSYQLSEYDIAVDFMKNRAVDICIDAKINSGTSYAADGTDYYTQLLHKALWQKLYLPLRSVKPSVEFDVYNSSKIWNGVNLLMSKEESSHKKLNMWDNEFGPTEAAYELSDKIKTVTIFNIYK